MLKTILAASLILLSTLALTQSEELLIENLEYKVWKIDSTVNHVSWMEVQFQTKKPEDITWIYFNVDDAETCKKEYYYMLSDEKSVAVKISSDTVTVRMNINNDRMHDPSHISVSFRTKQNKMSKYASKGDKGKFNLLCKSVSSNYETGYRRRKEEK